MSDDDLLAQFESLTLPFAQWTHRAHVRVAFLYLRANPLAVALSKVQSGIKAYNSANNVAESPTSGYNETTTVAFMRLVAATMAAYRDELPASTSDAFCDTHPQLMTRSVLRLFYSPERRMHPDAKTKFVEPDLAPLPRIL